MNERTYTITWRRPNGETTTCASLSPRIAFARLWAAWKTAGEITVIDVVPDWLTKPDQITERWPYPLPPPACEDDRQDDGWTCIMFDGTGFWCPACIQWSEDNAAVLEALVNR